MIFSADVYNSSSKGKQIYGYMQVHLLYPFQTFLYDRKNIPIPNSWFQFHCLKKPMWKEFVFTQFLILVPQ